MSIAQTTKPETDRVLPIHWGNSDPKTRGPIIARGRSEAPRNVIGAYDADAVYWVSLANATGARNPDHRPDLTYAMPQEHIIKPNDRWPDIVTFDPLGYMAPNIFWHEIQAGADIRSTIAITTANLTIPEITKALIRDGLPLYSNLGIVKSARALLQKTVRKFAKTRLFADGKILNSSGEIRVTKIAIHPSWYLPGMADRLGIAEDKMREALVDGTNGAHPELVTRPDLKVFLPPMKWATVYVFGDPQKLGDPSTFIATRPHDECNSSDVFGSDICTCRPYLMHGVDVCIRTAQEGGVGLIVYNNKEARNLGEITKYMVYQARKNHPQGDDSSRYFEHTCRIAGVEDARFQPLMPDIYRWLGVTRIDELVSMSSDKHGAIVNAGIEVVKRVPIPEHLIPRHARDVEMAAKIRQGYLGLG